ncbi:MAG: Hydroxyacylglutathione hydrolase [Candidatus Heimdallarchaeota archaeon LC_3]|nr:MAG: Hydroxyacylglutathione hydrolase [Candidatus Heimdallarchaeota archaeon LC_3]
MAEWIEWTENVWRVVVNQENIAYLIKCSDEELVVIDTGSSEEMAEAIFSLVAEFGLEPESIKAIFLTCTHPDHLGGLKLLKKKSNALIYVHESSKPVFEEGKKYVLEKQFSITTTGEKISLAWNTDIMNNLTKLPEPDKYIKGGEDIKIGDEIFIIQNTGGHSSDHILIHAYKNKASFIGDELGIYPDSEYSFFFDLTGSPEQRKKALKLFAKLKSQYLFPTFIPPIDRTDYDRVTQEAILAQEHLETTILETLSGYGTIKLKKLVKHIEDTLVIDWKSPYKELGVLETTIEVYLAKLIKENLVEFNEKATTYSFIEVEKGINRDNFY